MKLTTMMPNQLVQKFGFDLDGLNLERVTTIHFEDKLNRKKLIHQPLMTGDFNASIA